MEWNDPGVEEPTFTNWVFGLGKTSRHPPLALNTSGTWIHKILHNLLNYKVVNMAEAGGVELRSFIENTQVIENTSRSTR